MLSVHPSRTGAPTATWSGRNLHSRFDPTREAERFVRSRIIDDPSLVIVIGPGLGHLAIAIADYRPAARVIELHTSADLSAHSISSPSDSWHPQDSEPLEAFLGRSIGETDTVAVSVLEWTPVTDCFPGPAARLRESVAAVLRRRHASLLTEGAFGRRWLRNLVINFIASDRSYVLRPAAGEKPVAAVVVAASGPSLENSVIDIARIRERVLLWSTASALDAVLAAGLCPDLIIVTDSSFYAAEHLRKVIAGGPDAPPVAAPLSATSGLAGCTRTLIFGQRDPVEQQLNTVARLDLPQLPPNGTVSGSALAVCRYASNAPVVFAGLDAAWRDVASHARPHLSDIYRDLQAGRTEPALTVAWNGARSTTPIGDGWRLDRTLATYAEWFRTDGGTRSGLYRLNPSPVDVGLESVSAAKIAEMKGEIPRLIPEERLWPDRRARIEAVANLERSLVGLVKKAASWKTGGVAPTPREVRDGFSLIRRLELSSLIRWLRRESNAPHLSEIADSAISTIRAITGGVT